VLTNGVARQGQRAEQQSVEKLKKALTNRQSASLWTLTNLTGRLPISSFHFERHVYAYQSQPSILSIACILFQRVPFTLFGQLCFSMSGAFSSNHTIRFVSAQLPFWDAATLYL